ncbi:G-protein coupled receptor GRL101-like [Haliotis asinina]|uniref:G-protein coupled receptor GRL101-like n=1 Tax=Haliotis asinina TaxID=109174 RepID=UPI0035325F24
MGMTSGYIQDFQIFTSSDSRDSLSTHARLHREKGWCCDPDDMEPYIEVDLLTPSVMDAIVIQGWTEGNNARFVTSFYVGYRTGNGSYTWVGTENGASATEFRVDPEIHPATPQTLTLGRQVLARQVRLAFTHADVCLKLELLGCPMRPDLDLRCASPTSVTLGWQTMRRYQLTPPPVETTTSQLFAATWEDCFTACNNDTVDKCAQATWADTCDMVVTDRCAGFTYEAKTGQCHQHVGSRYSRHTKQWFLRGEGVTATYTQRMCIKGVNHFHECHATLTSPAELRSPSYPLYYGEGLECEWRVQFALGVFIQLTVLDIELATPQTQMRSQFSPTLGQCEDTLAVYDGPGTEAQLLWSVTGTDSVNFRESQLISSQSQLTLTFKSCYRFSETSARGFTLHINETDCGGCQHVGGACSGVPTCGDECGYINSPLFPHMYDDFSNCQWRIQGRQLEYVNVTFLWLDVIGGNTACDGDYVQLFDYDLEGTRTPLSRYCAERRPNGDILSSWNSLGVEFYSDGDSTGTGFQIKYSLVRTSLRVDASAPHEDGWYTLGDSVYSLNVHEIGITWEEARDKCSQTGGHLVSIRDQQEMSAVYALILSTNLFQRREVFIGLRKTVGIGWSWLDGRPLSFTDWYQDPVTRISQPDGLDQELCGMLVISTLQSTATWHDVACAFDQINQFVCEKNIGSFNNSGRPTLPVTNSPPDVTNMTYLYRCDNGEYISEVYRCDGVRDCCDASDEECNTTASDEGEAVCSDFRCGDGKCLSLQLYCDAHADCADASDETHCEFPACAASQFLCTSGQCVEISQRCDLKPDCLDHSDEEHCDFCPASTFSCYDGTCIPLRKRCDGHVDCGGAYHEDEDVSCVSQPPATCNDWFQLGQTQPGQFLVSPSGVEPFLVQCVFDESFAYTLVHHNKEDIIRITQEEGTAHVELTYQATREQINALKRKSSYCRQFLRMRCHHSNTIRKGNVYWNEWRGPKYTLNSSPFYCCFLRKTCQGSLDVCHCERTRESWYAADDNEWREDADYIFNTEALPVLKLFTTEVDFSEMMEYRLGPLECLQVLSRADLQARSFLCENGFTVSSSVRCRLQYDQFREPVGCKDLTHLRNCGDETCPSDYMKCPNSYCVSVSLVCDGRPDCQDGEDEMNCDSWACPGLYRCHASRTCLPWSHVCDGVTHCPRADDEFLCHVVCPDGCICDGPSVSCNTIHSTNIASIPSDVRALNVKTLDIHDVSFSTLTNLYQLNLSNAVVDHITSDMFSGLRNLRILDLSFNLLEVIGPNVFRDLQNLKTLVLSGNNRLRYLSPGAFTGLRNVVNVDLSRLAIDVLEEGAFDGLNGAVALTLEGNRISKIEGGAFQGLVSLKNLDLRNNPISSFTGDIFTGLSTLEHLYTDSYMFCCVRPPTVPSDQCLPPADEFSSCSDLMRNLALRVSMWILAFSALLGNMAVLAYRVVFDKSGLHKSNGMLVANLGIADFLMGVYMLIIASADVFFRGIYSWNDVTWRHSWLCRMSGFLSMVSAEASVLFLTVITLDRFIAIKYPFSRARLGRHGAGTACIIIWIISIVMAAVPLLPLPYFDGGFFSRSGVCLALPLTRNRQPGWAYSTAIFVVFNFLCFVVIAMGQTGIYREIRISGRRVQRQQRRIDLSVARKLSFIVISDFLCWFPITVMGLVAMSGHVIGGEVYAWVAVFVLPINSALNPVVYTLSSIGWTTVRTQVLGMDTSFSDKSTKREKLSQDYQSVIKQLRAGNTDIVFTQPPNSLNLTTFLASANQLSLVNVLHVARHVVMMVARLHAQGLVSGFVEEESVFLAVFEEGHLPSVWMSLNPSRPRTDSDFYTDIIDYGRLVSRMLRAYTVARKEQEKNRGASQAIG